MPYNLEIAIKDTSTNLLLSSPCLSLSLPLPHHTLSAPYPNHSLSPSFCPTSSPSFSLFLPHPITLSFSFCTLPNHFFLSFCPISSLSLSPSFCPHLISLSLSTPTPTLLLSTPRLPPAQTLSAAHPQLLQASLPRSTALGNSHGVAPGGPGGASLLITSLGAKALAP